MAIQDIAKNFNQALSEKKQAFLQIGNQSIAFASFEHGKIMLYGQEGKSLLMIEASNDHIQAIAQFMASK